MARVHTDTHVDLGTCSSTNLTARYIYCFNDYMTLTHTLENFPLYTVNFKATKTVPNYIASLKAIAICERI